MPPTALPSRHAGTLVSVSMEVIGKRAKKDTGGTSRISLARRRWQEISYAPGTGDLQEEFCNIYDDVRKRHEPNRFLVVY